MAASVRDPEEAKASSDFPALSELLWQLADDDLLIGFRASEWLGLGVHIEEDIAFASIAQDEMGHAMTYFQLLEALGMGRADDLAQLRPASERRNSILVEWPNGEGDYAETPHFDWAFTLVRHFLYDQFEIIRLEGLCQSRYAPLAEAAAAILGEKAYHRDHQQLWLDRLLTHGTESRARVERAVAQAAQLAGDLTDLGPWGNQVAEAGWWPGADQAGARWQQAVESFLGRYQLAPLTWSCPGNGRRGHHSPHLDAALAVLSEVYRQDPLAQW